MKQVLAFILCFLLCAGMMFSCTDPERKSGGTDFLAGADDVTVTDDAVTFTDASGTGYVTVPKHPKRVVCLYTSFTTLWYEAGGEVIGCIGGDTAAELYTASIGRDITGDDGVTVVSRASMAKKWDIEKILSLSPDLIICSPAMDGYATIKSPAAAADIPVIAASYDDFSDYLKWFKVFCHLNGREDLWETVALDALDAVNGVLEDSSETGGPRVLCLFSGSGDLEANTSETVVGGMLSALGAENIADSNGTGASRIIMNPEAIYAADPDIILVQCHVGTETAAAQVESVYGKNPVWQSLRAVREGRVYYLEKSLFHNKPNRRFADAYAILASILYE